MRIKAPAGVRQIKNAEIGVVVFDDNGEAEVEKEIGEVILATYSAIKKAGRSKTKADKEE